MAAVVIEECPRIVLLTSGSSDAPEGLPTGILKCQISHIWHFKGTFRQTVFVWQIDAFLASTSFCDFGITFPSLAVTLWHQFGRSEWFWNFGTLLSVKYVTLGIVSQYGWQPNAAVELTGAWNNARCPMLWLSCYTVTALCDIAAFHREEVLFIENICFSCDPRSSSRLQLFHVAVDKSHAFSDFFSAARLLIVLKWMLKTVLT